MVQLGSREEYHKKKKVRVLEKDMCPFCGECRDADSYHWSSEHWDIFHNKYPYSGDERHLMAIPKRHVTYANELTVEELADMHSIYAFMKDYYGEDHYFSFTRETMSGRSVEHYHVHFVPGTIRGRHLRFMLMHQGFPIQETLDL